MSNVSLPGLACVCNLCEKVCVQPVQKGVCAFWKYVRSGKRSVIVKYEVAEAVRVSVHREGMRCIYEARPGRRLSRRRGALAGGRPVVIGGGVGDLRFLSASAAGVHSLEALGLHLMSEG
jgi:hypothetical protein